MSPRLLENARWYGKGIFVAAFRFVFVRERVLNSRPFVCFALANLANYISLNQTRRTSSFYDVVEVVFCDLRLPRALTRTTGTDVTEEPTTVENLTEISPNPPKPTTRYTLPKTLQFERLEYDTPERWGLSKYGRLARQRCRPGTSRTVRVRRRGWTFGTPE